MAMLFDSVRGQVFGDGAGDDDEKTPQFYTKIAIDN